MPRLLLIAAAGAAGTLARHGVNNLIGLRSVPWATLVVNVVGSLALGWVLGWAPERWSPTALATVGVGFLGAFTTFSTLTNEVATLGRADRLGTAAGYLGLSIALGLVAAVVGYAAGRAVTSS